MFLSDISLKFLTYNCFNLKKKLQFVILKST